MNKRILSVLLVVALLAAACIFAVQANETDSSPVSYDVAVATQPKNGVYAEAVKMDFSDPNNLPTGCPYCGVETGITWQPLPQVTGDKLAVSAAGHFYVPEGGLSNTGYYAVSGATFSVCINLNGQNVTSTGRVLDLSSTSSKKPTVNIMGEGVVTGGATTGAATINANSMVNLCGGTYKHSSGTTRPTMIYTLSTNRGSANIYSGTKFTADEGVLGNNLVIDYGTINMYGGVIENATATTGVSAIPEWGANLLLKGSYSSSTTVPQYYGTTFYLYGGEIRNGSAKNGGNIALGHLYGNYAINLRLVGGKVSGGTAREDGGNVYVSICQNETYLVSVDGAEITGGSAKNGGNIFAEMTPKMSGDSFKATTVHFMLRSGSITDGTASEAGGNVYLRNFAQNHTLYSGAEHSLTMYNTYVGGIINVSGGEAKEGGNFYLDGYTNFRTTGSIANEYDNGTYSVYGGKATGNGGNIYVGADATLTIDGGGMVSAGEAGDGKTSATSEQNYGGNIYVAGTLTTNANSVVRDGRADRGGNIAVVGADAAATIKGSVLGGGAGTMGGTGRKNMGLQNICRKGSGQGGGNLYVDAGTATITGTLGELWETRDGANLYALNGAQVTLDNGAILDGGRADYNVAVSGIRTDKPTARYTAGNILVTGAETSLTINTGAIVRNGDARSHKTSGYGGNLLILSSATVTMNGGEISGGMSNLPGANVRVASGKFDLKGGEVKDGILGSDLAEPASDEGGANLYVAGGTVNVAGGNITGGSFAENGKDHHYSSNIYQTGGTINHTAGTISGGTGINGGNVMIVGNSAKYILNGGTVEGGYATSHGNNIYLRAGTLELLGGQINNTTTQVEDDSFEGNTVYVGALASSKVAEVIIGGNFTANACDYKSDIYANGEITGLVIKGDFTGDVCVSLASGKARPSSGYYGYHIGSEYEKSGGSGNSAWTTTGNWGATGAYTGKVTLVTSTTTSVAVFPEANGATEGNTHDLVIASIRGADEEGNNTWYATAEDAIESDDAYFALFANTEFEIPEGKTAFVNVNGKDITVSGEGNLMFFDAATSKGAVTVEGNVQLVNNSNNNKLVKNPQGVTYLTCKNENGTYSSYKLKVQLKGVSLRPSAAGVYFRGEWATELAGDDVDGYGVVVSLVEQPGDNFGQQAGMLWVEYKESMVEGEQKTGVEVFNILKKDNTDPVNTNAVRGKMPIYAASFVNVWNGEEMVTITGTVDTNGYSLYDVMNMMEDSETVWGAYADALNAFYNTWAADMADWEFERIGK